MPERVTCREQQCREDDMRRQTELYVQAVRCVLLQYPDQRPAGWEPR